MKRLFSICLALVWSSVALAGEVSLAVASNFRATAETLARAFENETGHTVTVSHAASGLIFAQIQNGAPFDVFLSSDTDRPARLLSEGLAREVKTYAVGTLVLVSRVPITRDTASVVITGERVALADPILAPYGKAATSAMERLTLDTSTFSPLVVANVEQAATLFAQGQAAFAFVSASSVGVLNPPYVLEGLVPALQQEAALLGENNPAATEFWQWLSSENARRLISDNGYDLP